MNDRTPETSPDRGPAPDGAEAPPAAGVDPAAADERAARLAWYVREARFWLGVAIALAVVHLMLIVVNLSSIG